MSQGIDDDTFFLLLSSINNDENIVEINMIFSDLCPEVKLDFVIEK